MLVGKLVLDLLALKPLNQLGEHMLSLVSAEELSVFAHLVLELAGLKLIFSDSRVRDRLN